MNRVLDFPIAILILLFVFIPMILISMIIFLVDRENPIYMSSRIGKNNKIFSMPKFRTMRSNTPQKATHLLDKPEHYLLSTGAFLRKYSLDELPQLISILKGDMAFVGPRPALYNQYDLIELRDKHRISLLKPGITGWAQVNGRDELSIYEKVQLDAEYLKKSSLSFDIYIIYLTFLKVFRGDGISH